MPNTPSSPAVSLLKPHTYERRLATLLHYGYSIGCLEFLTTRHIRHMLTVVTTEPIRAARIGQGALLETLLSLDTALARFAYLTQTYRLA